MKRVFFDYNATAPLRPEARAAMLAALSAPGNPSSVHAEGRAARRIVEDARAAVAALVGGDPALVTFTGGCTEANNTALTPHWMRGGQDILRERLLVGATEHPSVLAGGRFAPASVTTIPVDGNGVVDPESVGAMLGAEARPAMVSLMAANNETGVIQPVAAVAARAHEHGAIVHCDATQAIGRIAVDIRKQGADVLTLSSHKIGGPQGVGAIVRADAELRFAPLLSGGAQENRLRAGTENVAAIAGFGAAARAALADFDRLAMLASIRDRLAAIMAEAGRKVKIFGVGAPRLPQTLCAAVEGVSAETLLIALDLEGIAVSSGAACSSGKVAPSHVLSAMGVSEKDAKGAIRLSLGWDSKESDLDLFSTAWRRVLKHLAPGAVEAA